ncbi:MAG: GxxExxY protein [Armatimonadetes bacterium]|nr:GxxExxY protein [Armatimonadota bacterium]
MTENEITREIIDAAITVHSAVGPGLYESVYEALLAFELDRRGFDVETQRGIPVVYEDVKLAEGFRCDLIVEGKVIVEIKSVEALAHIHFCQLLTYLRLADKRVGLLINFNVPKLTDGIKRIVNKLPEPPIAQSTPTASSANPLRPQRESTEREGREVNEERRSHR